MALNPSGQINANALILVKLIRYAYLIHRDDSVDDEILNDAEVFFNEYVDGLIVRIENNLIFAFCGTNDFNDWFVNMDTEQVPGHRGLVHSGFFAAEKSIIKFIIKKINDFKPEWIWLAGHSAGGAVAILLADSLVRKFNNLSVYTFGASKVLNPLAAKDYKPMAYQFSNEFDLISLLPPNLFYRYVHVGKIIKLKSQTGFLNRLWYLIVRYFNWFFRRRESLMIETISEHHIGTYLDRLSEQ